jgi:hypothetical protein
VSARGESHPDQRGGVPEAEADSTGGADGDPVGGEEHRPVGLHLGVAPDGLPGWIFGAGSAGRLPCPPAVGHAHGSTSPGTPHRCRPSRGNCHPPCVAFGLVTGGEIAAAAGAAKALAAAAQRASEDDESLKQQLQEKAKDSPSMAAAAESYAKRVAVKQEILLKLFMPLAVLMGVSRDYFANDFATDIAKKIEDVPEEDLVAPRASVAVPAMQALGYSLDEPDLKEMYLNLLATAVDGPRSLHAHPSFAEVVRQLSGPEAAYLSTLLDGRIHPLVRIRRVGGEHGGYMILRAHVADLRDEETELPVTDLSMPVYVDNWVRLGLVRVSYSEFLTAPDSYGWAENRPELEELRRVHESDGVTVDFDRGHLSPTDFGRRFAATLTR